MEGKGAVSELLHWDKLGVERVVNVGHCYGCSSQPGWQQDLGFGVSRGYLADDSPEPALSFASSLQTLAVGKFRSCMC